MRGFTYTQNRVAFSEFVRDKLMVGSDYTFNRDNSDSAFISDLVDFINKRFEPEDIFSRDELVEWAFRNGFAK